MTYDFPDLIKTLNRLANSKTVPPRELLEDLATSAAFLLYNENPQIRPQDDDGVSGGLIILDSELPTLIIPDLHGRRDFMLDFLNWDFGEGPVLECLYKKTIQVVCVGDGFHTEKRGAKRWQDSLQEYNLGFRKHKNMDREMADSFGVMAMVMLLKVSFPDHFHFLKGNHENIKNENNLSDRAFGKYAYEGAMVREWVEIFMGEAFLETYSAFEQALPIFVQGDRFLISHAEPLCFHNRDEIINYRFDRSLVFDFSWTGNGQAQEGSVEEMFYHFIPDESNPYYFGGHRPVPNLFLTRANGRYVQIHNPDKEIVAFIRPDQEIDLDEIVIELKKKEV